MIDRALSSLIMLTGSNFNDYFSLFLLLIAVCCFLKYDILRLNRLSGRLEIISKGLDSIEADGMETLEDIDSLISEKGYSGLCDIWVDYYSDFQNIVQAQATLRLKDYFNINTVLGMPASRKRAEAVPGLLIVAGVLGDLIGLVMGIRHMSTTGTAAVSGNLLDTLASSLSLLIVVVLIVILYQAADRWLYQRAARKAYAFLAQLSGKIPQKSTVGYFETLLKEQQLQTNRMQEMMENIYGDFTKLIKAELPRELGKSFEASVSDFIAPSVNSIKDSISQLSKATLANQTEVIQKIVDNFVNNLGRALERQLSTLGKNIGKTSDSLKTTKENLDFLIRELIKNTKNQKEINSSSEQVVKAIARYQGDMSKSSTILVEALEKTGRFADTLTVMLEANRALVDRLNEQHLLLTQENTNYFENMNRMMFKVQEDLDLRIDDILSRFTDITQNALGKMESSMGATLEGLASSSGTMIENLDMQVRNMGSYTRELAEEVDELNDNLRNSVREFSEQLHIGVEKTFGDFDQGLGDICMRLGETVSRIRDSIDDLPVMMDEVRSRVAAVRENLL